MAQDMDKLVTISANLIKTVQTSAFPKALMQALQDTVSFDSLFIYTHDGEKPPINLFHYPNDKPAVMSLEEYQRGAYLLDPVFHAYQRGVKSGVYHLRDLAPDHFFRSEYYRSYYEKTQIISEMVMFVPMPESGTVVISLSRDKSNQAYGKKTLERLKSIEPIVCEAVIRHWRNPEIAEIATRPGQGRFDTLPGRIGDAVANAGRASLTNRETEVISLILRGYSSVSIAAMLDISTGTVKVHRKNLYAKLEISSQGELFSLFLPLLTQSAA